MGFSNHVVLSFAVCLSVCFGGMGMLSVLSDGKVRERMKMYTDGRLSEFLSLFFNFQWRADVHC